MRPSFLAFGLALASLSAGLAAATYPGQTTMINSRTDAYRLRHTQGLTLQWIDWDRRGHVSVDSDGSLWHLSGEQDQQDGPGRLFLDGDITEIGPGYFTFDGTIRITDTPDPGRACEKNKTWHFAVTQRRRYYRLREFEWCDYLTDYIDIYF